MNIHEYDAIAHTAVSRTRLTISSLDEGHAMRLKAPELQLNGL